jgi:hypothetical protein
MSNITVNINTNQPNHSTAMPKLEAVDDSIRAAAKERFLAEERAQKALLLAEAKKEQEKNAEIEATMLEESIKSRVKEEQIRIMAEKAVIEAETKLRVLAKETAIQVEMERLRNRTKEEVMQDTINELSSQIDSLKALVQPSRR